MENFNETGTEGTAIDSAVPMIDIESKTTMVDSNNAGRQSFVNKETGVNLPREIATIADFMKRPLYIAEHDWVSGDAFNTTIIDVSIGSQLQSNDYYYSKVKGFSLVRGTAVFRVLLNAQPFQQGRLLIRAIPMVNSMDSKYKDMMLGGGSSTPALFAQKTQHPCVELDCRDKAVEISLPFIAPVDWQRVVNPSFSWGHFYVDVMSPLDYGTTGAGATTAHLTCYLHFEDMEFAAPSYPESGKSSKYRASKMTEVEQKAMTTGTISEGLLKTSAIASKLGEIPGLTSTMKPVSWATNLMGGLASSFGFSKPQQDASSVVQSRQMMRYSATSNGTSTSFPLGIDAENEIVRSDAVTIRSEDEMSFNYLKRVNSYFFTYVWSDTLTIGQRLTNYPATDLQISPANFFNTGTVVHGGHTGTYNVYCPFSYFSNYFTFWRGSIELTFKIPKTQFHSGRLEVIFTPNNFGSYTAPGLVDGQYNLRWILDLSLGDEFTVTIPWLLEFNYLPVGTPSGRLYIRVINPLRNPPTAASQLNVLAFARAGVDFEYQAPSSILTEGNLLTPFYPQVGDGRGSIISDVIGSESIINSPLPSMLSIGEHFTSVKQLIQMTNYTMSTSADITLTNGFNLWPWYTGISDMNATTGALEPFPLFGDAYQFVAPLYLFYRGGVNIVVDNARLATSPSANNGVVANLLPNSLSGSSSTIVAPETPFLSAGTAALSHGFNGVALTDSGPLVQEFKIPYYNRTKCSLLHPIFSNTRGNYVDEPITTLNVYFGQATTCSIARSFAEDFQLSFFLCCPPILVGYT